MSPRHKPLRWLGGEIKTPPLSSGLRWREQRTNLMDREKQKRLERAGWRIGSASTFLKLTTAEEQLVEMKLSLGTRLRKARQRRNLTQAALAERMGSSQSRVAKMEAGDRAVSLDLLVQGLLAAGATPREIANALAAPKKAASA